LKEDNLIEASSSKSNKFMSLWINFMWLHHFMNSQGWC